MPSHVPSAQPWSQESAVAHIQTPLWDAVPTGSDPCAPPHCPTLGTLVVPLVLLGGFLGACLVLPRPTHWLIRPIRLG